MPDEERDDEQTRRFRTLKDWESSVDQTLREAIERGEFDNLKGKGKPLEFDDNPFTPADWRLAFKMLQDAGYAPDWIELDKDIRKLRAELQIALDRHARWEKAERARIQNLAADRRQSELAYIRRSRERVIQQSRQRATELNKSIDIFNLKAPSSQVHITRIRIDEMIALFESGLDS
jgi:hypothetical protein